MFDRKNDVARNKKRADAIVYAGAADEVVLTQSDFESEEEFRRWKAWSDADYKQTEKAMRRDYDHVIYGWMERNFGKKFWEYVKSYLQIIVSAVVCVANIEENILLVPIIGGVGAAISTGLS
ncbi:MAG: hypothetical protein ACLU06_08050 [Eggerthellaceae bacterium]